MGRTIWMKTPDRQRLLSYLRANEGREINAFTEIVNGLKILEYTGRLTDCRKMIGCTCASNIFCTSQEHIVNTRKGYYKYIGIKNNKKDKKYRNEEDFMVSMDEMKQKREELIKKYRAAKAKGDEAMMKIIEVQGKAIRNAIEREKIKIGLF